MKSLNINPGLGIMATVVTGAILIISFRSIAIAAPEQQVDRGRINPEQFHERMQEHLQARLDKLAQRLEIKASQQPGLGRLRQIGRNAGGWQCKETGQGCRCGDHRPLPCRAGDRVCRQADPDRGRYRQIAGRIIGRSAQDPEPDRSTDAAPRTSLSAVCITTLIIAERIRAGSATLHRRSRLHHRREDSSGLIIAPAQQAAGQKVRPVRKAVWPAPRASRPDS